MVSIGSAVAMAAVAGAGGLVASILLALMAKDGWEGGGLISALTTKSAILADGKFAATAKALISGQPAAAAMGIFDFMQVPGKYQVGSWYVPGSFLVSTRYVPGKYRCEVSTVCR